MKRASWTAVVWLLVCCGTTIADTRSDDFNAGISPNLWTVFHRYADGPIWRSDPTSPWTVAAPDAQGRLRVSKPADSGGRNTTIHAGVRSTFQLIGDFEISAHFDLLTFPNAGQGYNEALFNVTNEDGTDLFEGLRFVLFSTQYSEAWTEVNDVGHAIGGSQDSTMSGRFILTRQEETLSAFIDRGAGPVLLGSEAAPDFLQPLYVEMYAAQVVRSASGTRSFSALNIRWDNFTATADVITPEPATLSLLALGGVAVLRRRRK
jgi:hypothetical protein